MRRTRLGETFAGLMVKMASKSSSYSAPSQLQATPFHCDELPSISIPAYATRLQKYMQFGHKCVVAALVYISRLERTLAGTGTVITPYTIHRLILTTLVVAVKMYGDDVPMTNLKFAAIGGITLKEMNALEAFLLRELDFRILVRTEEYANCAASLALQDETMFDVTTSHC
eukprot:c7335_g1_i1.p2 GENE.c7335_g1_i1~~c7335_g1_i1.p2  ORF type:complete len:191 (+),score=33.57 c7335_g1_i1:63-575(+)